MLQDAGRASQQARNVSSQKLWLVCKTSDDKSEKTQLAKDFEPVQDTPITKFSDTSKARSRHRSPISTKRGPRWTDPSSDPASPGGRNAFHHAGECSRNWGAAADKPLLDARMKTLE
ncbi:hypothetical protein XPA_001650 [Xanthoria parietina]